MSLDRELEQIYARLDRHEEKLDRLLNFRGWVLGAVAVISAGVSAVVTLVTGVFGR